MFSIYRRATVAVVLFCLPLAVAAQNLATKKIVTKYEVDYIPEFKSSLAYRSNVPELGKIDVAMDFASFGDNAAQLDLAVRELNQIKGAVLFLAKDADSRAAILKSIQKITVRMSADKAAKGVKLSGGTLTVTTNSFELTDLVSTSTIQAYLEKNL